MNTSHAFPLKPTPIHVSDKALDDLRARLTLTRSPLDGDCPRICVGMDELERHAFYENQDCTY